MSESAHAVRMGECDEVPAPLLELRSAWHRDPRNLWDMSEGVSTLSTTTTTHSQRLGNFFSDS